MKGSLFRKYAAVLMLFVGIVLIAGGAAEVAFNYAETRAQVELRQDDELLKVVIAHKRWMESHFGMKADRCYALVRDYLKGVEMQIRDVSGLPWGLLRPLGRRDEYHRLLKLVPAIAEIRSIDAEARGLFGRRLGPRVRRDLGVGLAQQRLAEGGKVARVAGGDDGAAGV